MGLIGCPKTSVCCVKFQKSSDLNILWLKSEITCGHLPFLAAVSLRPESHIIDSQTGFMPTWDVLEKGIVVTATRN